MGNPSASMDDRRGARLGGAASAALSAVPVIAAVILVLLPVAAVVWRASGRAVVDTDGAVLGADRLLPAMGRTFLATGVIALVALMMAWPGGWLLRTGTRGARRLGAFVLVPMLLPSYLAYAGWNLLRAPRTFLGDRLADAPAWVSDWVGPVLGVWGLALWAWPLAALVLGAAARRIDQSVLDTLDLDGPSRGQRLLVLMRLMRPGLIGAAALVMLVMTGSMVPLDVSRLDTYAVILMRWLNEHPSDLPVWRASWPLLVVAAGAALAILRLRGAGGTSLESPSEVVARGRARRGWVCWMLAVWVLAVVVPGVLFLLSLRNPPHSATLQTIKRFLWAFWRDSGDAVVSSTWVAARVGVIALVVSGCAWYAASRGSRGSRLVAACAWMLLVTGLVPGVLVGTAVRRGVDMAAPAIGNTSWLVVGAHLTRFAFVGMLIALWLAGQESREERDLRLMDGADTPGGFAHACLARHWGVLIGGALATAILSFHEIEATVVTWPPGMRNLAQEMLDCLHFARDERLGAAAVNLMGAGIAAAYLAGWLMLGGRETVPEKTSR